MQDIPFFHTENGIASLRLKEIPYFKTAYITIQSASNENNFLQECIEFCRAVGADKIYATGCASAGEPINVIKMTRDVGALDNANAMLFPVQEETMPRWRELYNLKMRNITGAVYLTEAMAGQILSERKAYFVHKNGELIGIGTSLGDEISAVASVQKGAGKDVVCALLGALSEERVVIEVASDNVKAMMLYASLDFVPSGIVRSWYKIFDNVK